MPLAVLADDVKKVVIMSEIASGTGQPATQVGVIGYLGPQGTFAQQALHTLLGTDIESEPLSSVTVALDAVRSGEVAAALVPIENSVEGAVSATLDELSRESGLQIVAEVAIAVRFCLAVRAGQSQIRTVVTHPHAQAQCRNWLTKHYPAAELIPAASTANAAAAVARGDFDAAICAEVAAHTYGLELVADDIADNRDAQTRFILVRQPGPCPAPTGADKTTLELYMRQDHPGALLEILTQFAVRGVNLTRIESRPTKTTLGSYYFSVDAEGHIAEERVADALKGLYRVCARVNFQGSYPRHDGELTTIPRGNSDEDFSSARAWFLAIRTAAFPHGN